MGLLRRRISPHPKSLSQGRGTLIPAPFSLREKGWGCRACSSRRVGGSSQYSAPFFGRTGSITPDRHSLEGLGSFRIGLECV